MKILCKCSFKHGRDAFEQGDIRTVSDEDGEYFLSNGWAVADDGTTYEAFVGELSIKPDDSFIGITGGQNG